MKPVEIIGNEQILDPLREAIEKNALCGCYLIEGPEGSGKKTIAKYLCALLSCERPDPDGRPCFSCRGCENVYAFSHPDLFVIAPEEQASSISVSVVREANRAAASAPISARRRVFLIPEAEKLGVEAQNALLKNLEEPVQNAVYLLLACESSVLLPTVLSRAVRYRTQSLSEEVVLRELTRRFPDADAGERLLAARVCGGALGIAERCLRDPDFRLRRETAQRYLDALCEGADFPRFCAILPPETKRDALKLFYPLLLAALRDALCVKEAKGAAKPVFLETVEPQKFALVSTAKLLGLADQVCELIDPSMQNAHAAGSVALLNSLASAPDGK